ncbi:MAG: hypothetical protein ACKVOA_03065 [Methylophilaceae bacterium]
MKRMLSILLTLSPLTTLAGSCNLTEKQLIGDWHIKSGPGAFEEMSFELDENIKVFNSWLHQRPEISDGTWSLKNCVLRVNHPTETTFSFTFSARLSSKNTLELKEGSDPKASYRRLISDK